MSTGKPAVTLSRLNHSGDIIQALHAHLSAICAVEFYTIPLYLTATYSFSVATGNSSYQYVPKENCNGGSSKQNLFFWIQQKSLSVAVQEMYHLQCASNIANAVGFSPQLDPSIFDWTGPVPHLPSVKGVGLNNLPATLDVLIGIETPAEGGFPPPNMEVAYDSISALYHATLVLLDKAVLLEELFPLEPGPVIPNAVPNQQTEAPNQMDYLTFQSRYIYTVVKCKRDIAHLANAVSFQGEGAGVVQDFATRFPNLAKVLQQGDDGSNGMIPTQYQSAPHSRFAAWDCTSHYDRFVALKATLDGNVDYDAAVAQLPAQRTVFNALNAEDPDRPNWVASPGALDTCINLAYSRTLDIINQGMKTGGGLDPATPGGGFTFTEVMTSFKYLIPQLWQWGQVPSFSYVPGVTDDQLQAAFDEADPLCLYHWDAVTAEIRKGGEKDMNVCQGLNTCKGLGWGGLGTKAGDGACATADIHTCVGGNTCTHLGACGFIATDKQNQPLPCEDLYVPGANSCKGKGGCQVPISDKQLFSADLPSTCTGRDVKKGDSVWQEARKLFAKAQNVANLPAPNSQHANGGVNYDGTARRAAVTPTST
ncbi:hypothetical protein C7S18_08785 [Ahniella affigens]|uniref:Iminophenyl-pyruvate dimer synthase domain-containing protein n=1 Tax=Ahniella affigens TaxID=2021234 RepID=A0A2P1PR26_9GAMM|nr:ferritin-like domain-containing protein [Ahniella affigens]AVP97282.1 hypothetical protein C7S18_08785 [Ahniella affigens]